MRASRGNDFLFAPLGAGRARYTLTFRPFLKFVNLLPFATRVSIHVSAQQLVISLPFAAVSRCRLFCFHCFRSLTKLLRSQTQNATETSIVDLWPGEPHTISCKMIPGNPARHAPRNTAATVSLRGSASGRALTDGQFMGVQASARGEQ